MKRDIKKLVLGASVVGVITMTSGCTMMGMGGMDDGSKDAPSGMMGMMGMMRMMGMGGMDDSSQDTHKEMDNESKKAPTIKADDNEKCGGH